MPTNEARELLERWVRHADAYGEGPSHLCETTRAYLTRTAPEGREESVWSGTVDSENPRIASLDPPPRSSAQGAREAENPEDLFSEFRGPTAQEVYARILQRLTGQPMEESANGAELIESYATALAAERVRERDREWWGAICPGGERDPLGPMDPEIAREYVAEGRRLEADERVREALEKAAGAICHGCAEGESVETAEWGELVHPWSYKGNKLLSRCEAAAIRALIPEEEKPVTYHECENCGRAELPEEVGRIIQDTLDRSLSDYLGHCAPAFRAAISEAFDQVVKRATVSLRRRLAQAEREREALVQWREFVEHVRRDSDPQWFAEIGGDEITRALIPKEPE